MPTIITRLATRRRLLAAVLLGITAVGVSYAVWKPSLSRALVCNGEGDAASVVVLDNFDYEYGIFKWGAQLERQGARVVVPVTAAADADARLSAEAIAAALARVAGLSRWDMIPVQAQEPVSLHTAYAVRDFLLAEHISSVRLVSSGFRSRRSELVYRSVLNGSGISVSCLPVFGTMTPDNWTSTWHGIQDVSLQFLKLQYYRCWILPFAHRRT